MDDFKKITYGVLGGFALLMVVWLGFIYVSSCGLDITCRKGAQPVFGTPIPTLSAAHIPSAPKTGGAGEFNKCEVKAMELVGAWVDAGYPETDPFLFADVSGNPCEGTFDADIMPLFSESNVWFPASLSCTSCHNAAFKEGLGGLDFTSYTGILAGSGRASADIARGEDILGGGYWLNSRLYQSLSLTENIPSGHPPVEYPAADLVIYAGVHVSPEASASTPAP